MTDVKVEQCDRDIWFQIIAVSKTYADADMLAAARRNIDSGMYDDLPAMRAIAFSRQAAEKATRERGFNVNENVWVKLTDEGRAYHRRWYIERYPMLPYRVPDESNDGWSKWQMWSLIQEFGDAIHMGGHVPFETTIRLTDPATAIRSQNDD